MAMNASLGYYSIILPHNTNTFVLKADYISSQQNTIRSFLKIWSKLDELHQLDKSKQYDGFLKICQELSIGPDLHTKGLPSEGQLLKLNRISSAELEKWQKTEFRETSIGFHTTVIARSQK